MHANCESRHGFHFSIKPGAGYNCRKELQPLSGEVVEEKRTDDLEKQARFRTDRMIEHNGEWFFCTREGTIQGPFADKFSATYQLKMYIDAMTFAEAGKLSLQPLEPIDRG